MSMVTTEELKALPLRYLIALAVKLEELLPPDDPIGVAKSFTTQNPKVCHDGAARIRSERAIACAAVRAEIGRATVAAIRAGQADALYSMAEEASDHWASAEEDARTRWREYREYHAVAVDAVASAVKMSACVVPESDSEIRREFENLRQLPRGTYERLGSPIAEVDAAGIVIAAADDAQLSSEIAPCRASNRRRCGR